MDIQFQSDAVIQEEEGYTVRRLYPWHGRVESPWGSAWVVIQPGMYSTPHWHDEEETFLILSGTGEMIVDGQTRAVTKGDVIYLPRCSTHTLKNADDKIDLEMLCIWWGGNEKTVNNNVSLEQALSSPK
jgi:mannose-6-phosphate isomerase-like protein (cupin superfamily)